MLITKEQQEALVYQYIKAGHTQDECIGFIDGIVKTIELIEKISNNKKDIKMKIKTRFTRDFVDIKVTESGSIIETTVFKNDKRDIQEIIDNLLITAFELSSFTDKTIKRTFN